MTQTVIMITNPSDYADEITANEAPRKVLCECVCVCVCQLGLTAVVAEALVADLPQPLEALVEVSHLLLQVRVPLVQHVLLGVALRWRDHVLVDFCRRDKQTTISDEEEESRRLPTEVLFRRGIIRRRREG